MIEAPTVSGSRRSVIDALKRRGEATAEELADDLGISVAGARQHLVALGDTGLVDGHDEPRSAGTRGRVRRRYTLAPGAEALFPRAEDELVNELLRHVDVEDPSLVGRLFDRRRDGRIAAATTRLDGASTLGARVAELAAILDEDGYVATWEADPDGSFRIIEHNCAILSVAQARPDACRSEIEFLRSVLPGASVERVQHIVAGAHRCAYLIRADPP